jgi:hypothetical protein
VRVRYCLVIGGRRAVVIAAAVLALAGCGSGGASDRPTANDHSSPVPVAADAGGACLLLDFDQINKALSTGFDVAAAGQSGETYTCVLRAVKAEYPTLTVAVTATHADVGVFQSNAVWPKGATFVGDLGQVAYRVNLGATSDHGPGVEVGWLSGNQRLIIVRLQVPKGSPLPDYQAVVALAQIVDTTSV